MTEDKSDSQWRRPPDSAVETDSASRPGRPRLISERETPNYASYAQALLDGRRRFSRFIPGSFFHDPAFDMLLDLFVAAETGEARAIKACSFASRVPTSTALRVIGVLVDAKLIERHPDANDGRRTLLRLAPATRDGMRAWLNEISSIPLRRDWKD